MTLSCLPLPGYQILGTLYDGARTTVYRGRRSSDAVPVVIKVLKHTYPSFLELVRFRALHN
ncbi:MAG: hypothetical protein F6K19_52015 [Cyanothece sp. SIO1E1]|nr:hypothetical protein [Cyanothece sp. SIO1E1]